MGELPISPTSTVVLGFVELFVTPVAAKIPKLDALPSEIAPAALVGAPVAMIK